MEKLQPYLDLVVYHKIKGFDKLDVYFKSGMSKKKNSLKKEFEKDLKDLQTKKNQRELTSKFSVVGINNNRSKKKNPLYQSPSQSSKLSKISEEEP